MAQPLLGNFGERSPAISRIAPPLSPVAGERPIPVTANPLNVENILNIWQSIPLRVARQMIEAYGYPNEATMSRMTWFENGPWKQTTVHRDEVRHNFPFPHADVLAQYIDYRVPAEKMSELALFDGSIVAERTRGEISARGDSEAMNFLLLNLTHDIVTGIRSVANARDFYAAACAALLSGERPDYAVRFLFDLPQGGTQDAGETCIDVTPATVTQQRLGRAA